MPRNRIACVLIPNFSMAVCLRVDRTLAGKAVALTDGGSPPLSESSPIHAINDIASDAGVSCDMTVARGKSYCPELIVKKRDTKRERSASDKIRRLLFTASPLIEESEPGCFFVDASGLNWLYKNEKELARRLVSLIGSLKIPVKVGVANNKFVAKTAALVSPDNSPTVVPAQSERRFLNHLSIDYLGLSDETHERFLALGLKTIGQVAAFPTNEMTTRFGEEGARLSRLARGDDVDHFLPEFARVKLSARIPFFEPLESTHAVVAHVEKSLTEILDKLSRIGRGCATIDIKLHLDDKSDKSVRLALRQPIGTPYKFIRLLVNKLNGPERPEGRVTDITITIPEVIELTSSQLDLMPTSGSLKGQLTDDSRIMEELRRVTLLSASVNNAVIPDHSFDFHKGQKKAQKNLIPPQAVGHPNNKIGYAYALKPVAGLRLLQPAQKATVVASGEKLQQLKLKNDTRPIVEQNGPWEISGGWWKFGFDRMYYEVQTDDRGYYLVYFDRRTPGWYVQGVFD